MRSLRRSDGADAGPPRRQTSIDADRALQSERARFAASLDLELRLACRNEATMRRELGEAARAFVHRRAYRRLGFVRLSDYARERLGVSARTLQSAAWLATRLDALPAISRAYDRSELSWAQARAVCRVAVAADEDQWLVLARRSTVETLERLVARARHPDGVPADPEGETNDVDGEPAVRWRFACPARVRALWRRALELASRAAGEPLADWQAAEVVAAEGWSGRPAGGSLGDRALIEAVRLAQRNRRDARHGFDSESSRPIGGRAVTDAGTTPVDGPIAVDSLVGMLPTPTLVPTPHEPPLSDDAPAPRDSFALDARLCEAVRVLRTIEPRIGRLLRVVVDQRIYRSFGHPAFADYVRERLGISARKAWALLKVEKATLRSGDLERAYRDGRLSWVRALSLLPVLDRQNAAAWITRAESVTIRRLNDEIEWVLASRDVLGPSVSLAPPPVDSPLLSPFGVTSPEQRRDLSPAARLQIRAHGAELTAPAAECRSVSTTPRALEVCDADIRFTGPASVIALLRDVLDAFADPAEPRWTALERLLRHVITHWESLPRHPDPVFARDGWRCTVPACSSRRNLHDHHIRFRSRGGDNTRDNRTTVCAAHHLHGIHDATIQASGTAPHAIEWRLGVRPGTPPFLSLVGDRYCSPETPNRMVMHAGASSLP
ncbi:MAG: HNH endonuclease signature motif containing protein [Candidatus Binatia bacterium]